MTQRESRVGAPLELGGWTIRPLLEGRLRLDGGAMWGVVPKNLWAKLTPPAEDNTIHMACRSFLCERGAEKVLIEAGVGDRWDAKHTGIYHLDGGHLGAALKEAGCDSASVTHAIGSHAHWDHIGGWVTGTDEEPRPLLPNARHHLARIEVERCLDNNHARKGSYRPQDLQPLIDAGLVDTFEGSAEIVPGLSVLEVGGHSDGVSVVMIEGDDAQRAVFWADVCPTTHHVQPPYIMAYDIDVKRSFERRKELLRRSADEGWIGLFYHDADTPVARVVHDGRRFGVEPVA